MGIENLDRAGLVKDQASGIVVDLINEARLNTEQIKQIAQDEAFEKAIHQVAQVREFVGSPEKILGSDLTKHGEIAEQVEVGIRNARAVLFGHEMTATFDDVGRTAAEDYLISGVEVQSKFINGASNNLDAVLEHMEKYEYFGRDGSYYHIPEDTHEKISKVLQGDHGSLSTKSVNAILDKVHQIEMQSGKPFDEVVRPGISQYGEIQKGTVHKTLDGHEQKLSQDNAALKEQIALDSEASLSEAAYAAGVAAAVGGTLTFATGIYEKYKSGKNPFRGEFSVADWKEVGLDTAKGSAVGGLTGVAIYALTNSCDLAAPYAAAVVSAAKGVGALMFKLNSGEIDFDQFIDLSMIVCSESAVIGLATVAGQTLIPIPIVGAVLGSIAGRLIAEFATGKTEEVANRIRENMNSFTSRLDEVLRSVIESINAEFDRLGSITETAFDIERNRNLIQASLQLAKVYGVSDNQLISNQKDLDDFMHA